jgi:hypothetical protein
VSNTCCSIELEHLYLQVFSAVSYIGGKARSLPMKLSKLWQGILTKGGGGGDQYS